MITNNELSFTITFNSIEILMRSSQGQKQNIISEIRYNVYDVDSGKRIEVYGYAKRFIVEEFKKNDDYKKCIKALNALVEVL